MCCCAKPNVNGQPGYSWDGRAIGTREPDPPTLDDNDVLLFDEPGRCGVLDSHCHHYRLVKNCGVALLVRHGGGDERIWPINSPITAALEQLDSNGRYWLLNAIYHAYADGRRSGSDSTMFEYRKAFIEGRLKKRKSPSRDWYKVWIEPQNNA